MCTRTQKKRAVTPQETEPDMLVSVWKSPAEVCIDTGLKQVRDTEYNSPGSRSVLASVLLKEVTINSITATIVWPQARKHSPTQQKKIILKIY